MKLNLLFILVGLVLIFQTCRNDDESSNVIDPTIGGFYTEIQGSISGILSIDDSPFLVKEDINIPNGAELIIDAGVSLFFEAGKHFIVNGVLVAEGTKQRPITFTSFLSSWSGISITSRTDTSKFSYCVIQEVYQQTDETYMNGAIEVNNSNLTIENCLFRINSSLYGGALYLINSYGSIKNSVFRDNDADYYGGAILSENSTAVIINNTFYKNACYNFGGGIVLWDPLSAELQNNIFYKNYSFTGDPSIAIAIGDSANISMQYNFIGNDIKNPMFISGDNLHLSPRSPCKDNGNPDTLYNDFDGTRNDQGAFGGPAGNW